MSGLGKSRALTYQQLLFSGVLLAFFLYGLLTYGLGLLVFAAAVWCVRHINLSLYRARTHADYSDCLTMTVQCILLLALSTVPVGLIF